MRQLSGYEAKREQQNCHLERKLLLNVKVLLEMIIKVLACISKALGVTAFQTYVYGEVFVGLELQQVALFIRDSLGGNGRVLNLVFIQGKREFKFIAYSQLVKLAERHGRGL